MNHFKQILCFALAVLAISSCNAQRKGKHKNRKTNSVDCSNVMCTEEFRSVTIKITGGQLDEAYTIDAQSKKTVKVADPMTDDAYVVLDDTYVKPLQNGRGTFHFIGKIRGKEVVNEVFVISADCCHISKVSGSEKAAIK